MTRGDVKRAALVLGTVALAAAVLLGLYQLAVFTTSHCACEVHK